MTMSIPAGTARVCAIAAAVLLPLLPVSAQVVVQGTRQIFPGDAREITVRIENVGKRASLVQGWIDEGDRFAEPEASNAPFVIRCLGATLPIRAMVSGSTPERRPWAYASPSMARHLPVPTTAGTSATAGASPAPPSRWHLSVGECWPLADTRVENPIRLDLAAMSAGTS